MSEEEKKEYFTTDEEGEYVKAEGVLTQEELDTRLEEFKAEGTKEAEGVTETHKEEIKTLTDKITELEESDDGKDPKKKENLVRLRKAKETAEEILKKVDEKYKGEIEGIRKDIKDEKINSAIKSIVGDDAEIQDKVKLHYDNFKGEPKDKKEMIEMINNAVILATGSKLASPLDGIIGTGSGTTPGEAPKGKISSEAVDMAENLGISKEELKKRKLL